MQWTSDLCPIFHCMQCQIFTQYVILVSCLTLTRGLLSHHILNYSGPLSIVWWNWLDLVIVVAGTRNQPIPRIWSPRAPIQIQHPPIQNLNHPGLSMLKTDPSMVHLRSAIANRPNAGLVGCRSASVHRTKTPPRLSLSLGWSDFPPLATSSWPKFPLLVTSSW